MKPTVQTNGEATSLFPELEQDSDQRFTTGWAGLDVFEHEPAVNPKLLALDNVILLPHMSSATFEGRVDMGEKVVVNIQTFVDNHTPPDLVIGDAV